MTGPPQALMHGDPGSSFRGTISPEGPRVESLLHIRRILPSWYGGDTPHPCPVPQPGYDSNVYGARSPYLPLMGTGIRIPVLVAVLVLLASFAGCTSPAPTLSILSPQDGATVPAGDITVTIKPGNFHIVEKQGRANVAGEGHVHFYMDAGTVPSTPGAPAIPAAADTRWAPVAGTAYTFTDVPSGTHTFTVQLVNNDQTPVIPLTYRSVTVTVPVPPVPAVTFLSPRDEATIAAGDVPVTLQVENFRIVDAQGQANEDGAGHLHYYVDIGTVPFVPGAPAIPSRPDILWGEAASTGFIIPGLPPGIHTLSVQLVNHDHTPVIPLAFQSVMVIGTGVATVPPSPVPVAGKGPSG